LPSTCPLHLHSPLALSTCPLHLHSFHSIPLLVCRSACVGT
jgi:hypothetical protein